MDGRSHLSYGGEWFTHGKGPAKWLGAVTTGYANGFTQRRQWSSRW